MLSKRMHGATKISIGGKNDGEDAWAIDLIDSILRKEKRREEMRLTVQSPEDYLKTLEEQSPNEQRLQPPEEPTKRKGEEKRAREWRKLVHEWAGRDWNLFV